MYPLMVNMENKECIVVGGGKVAYRKVCSLLNEGAFITIISPEVCPELEILEAEKKISVIKRRAEDDDFRNAFYIIAATNNENVNEYIAKKFEQSKLVNIASSVVDGNCQVPASFKKGRLTLTVSTNGASPMLAKKIRDEWSAVYDDNFEQYIDFLYETREKIKQLDIPQAHKKKLLQEIIDEKYQHDPSIRNTFNTSLQNF
ncbi:NAD(P)-binding protein [Niallia sp. 03133]|uniref:NAD(P)-binding protein n=1 Tax=Niallia sp. 03133 TaxID=3458060 RepID=UPI00404412B3